MIRIDPLRADIAASHALAEGFRDAVLDELIVDGIYCAEHETDPRKALRDLIQWNVDVALDPRVSEPARALQRSAPNMITLTLAQIVDLAYFSGLNVTFDPNVLDPGARFTVTDCPREGIRNVGEESDPDSVSHYSHIVCCAENVEDWCAGLGPEIDPEASA